MKHRRHDARTTPCRQVHLTQSSMGEICICPDCWVVHVALQYFSMRFEPDAFKTLQAMFCEAQSKIAQQQVQARPAVVDEFAAVDADGACKSIVH